MSPACPRIFVRNPLFYLLPPCRRPFIVLVERLECRAEVLLGQIFKRPLQRDRGQGIGQRSPRLLHLAVLAIAVVIQNPLPQPGLDQPPVRSRRAIRPHPLLVDDFTQQAFRTGECRRQHLQQAPVKPPQQRQLRQQHPHIRIQPAQNPLFDIKVRSRRAQFIYRQVLARNRPVGIHRQVVWIVSRSFCQPRPIPLASVNVCQQESFVLRFGARARQIQNRRQKAFRHLLSVEVKQRQKIRRLLLAESLHHKQPQKIPLRKFRIRFPSEAAARQRPPP